MTFPAGLGLRASRGGAVLVAVSVDGREPRLLLSTFLPTAADGDRLALQPYHVAAGMPRGPDGAPSAEARDAVAEGRRRQDACATERLSAILDRIRTGGGEASVAALLVNRAGWVTDLLAYSLAFADHPPVAEGLAVRDALRAACARVEIPVEEVDEKSLPEQASKFLHATPTKIDARLKALGASAGKPWRKEQKLACLAAWTCLSARR